MLQHGKRPTGPIQVDVEKKRKITFDPMTTPGLPKGGDEPGFGETGGDEARAMLSRIEAIVGGEGSYDTATGPISIA